MRCVGMFTCISIYIVNVQGINEHRPNSNYNKSNGMVSSPKLSYKKELFVKKVHNGPVITLNLNGFSPDAVTSSHCNVVDIVGSCFYDPQVTYSFCKRITSSSPLGLLYGSVHTPPLQSPGAHDDAQQEQEFENKKQTIVNWVCTGLCPQYLVMSLDTTYCIKDITIECYGKVNQVNIRLYNCSVTGSLSGSTPVLLAPGLMECTRTME